MPTFERQNIILQQSNIMHPISFPEQNFEFTKPSNMRDDQCGSLPVAFITTEQGFPGITSVFQPSKEERDLIAAGGPVYLTIISRTQPPVIVSAVAPWISGAGEIAKKAPGLDHQ